jgi:hypothetical protein
MTLITSKINSLACLKSAIYISVMGGVILSSTPVLSAQFVFPPEEDEDEISFIVREGTFLDGRSTLRPNPRTTRWNTRIEISRTNGPYLGGGDTLAIDVYLQHIVAPHEGDNNFGGPLHFRLFVDSANPQNNVLSNDDWAFHPGRRPQHVDRARGSVSPRIGRTAINSDILDWTLDVRASHSVPVPEPTTILGTVVALGWGGWLKRKNSIK